MSAQKKKVLVVDDDSVFVETIKRRLEAEDYEVITASDGKQALELVRTNAPDVVLLDIMMPELNGLDTLQHIRKINRALPVFLLTAYADKDKFEAAQSLEASGFMSKTGDLKEQIKNITNMLNITRLYKAKEQ